MASPGACACRAAGPEAPLPPACLPAWPSAQALRPGGRLVYSTCSILGLENDGVVDRVLQLAGDSVRVISHTLRAPPGPHSGPSSDGAAADDSSSDDEAAAAAAAAAVAALEGVGAERTRHGWLLLPDAPGLGGGPIYVAVLHKTSSSALRRVKVNKYARQ